MLRNNRPKNYMGDGNGIVWPNNGNSTPPNISETFGPRLFPAHIITVGYDYDFHRGIDVDLTAGDPVYSPINGSIIRLHETFFGWESAQQLTKWTETDPSSSVTFSMSGSTYLNILGSRVGNQNIVGVGYIKPIKEKMITKGDDWEYEINLSSSISSAGGNIGIGVINSDFSQYATLEYDGNNFISFGKDTDGIFSTNNSSSLITDKTWWRLSYVHLSASIYYKHSTDGDTYTTFASESNVNFSGGIVPTFSPIIYWRSIDTNATPTSININSIGWVDTQTIGRFGNWVEIGTKDSKFLLYHMQDILTSIGAKVLAGQQIGTVGNTGFDATSGRVITPHIHLEWVQSNVYEYSRNDSVNPLSASILPRVNVSNNVTASVSTANDPNGNTSWRLNINITRADQDFDINEISLTGNLATRTVNWNTRAGLNTDNDIPTNNGVYIVANAFSSSANTLTWDVYFNKATLGTSFVSYTIKDTRGVTVFSG